MPNDRRQHVKRSEELTTPFMGSDLGFEGGGTGDFLTSSA
jgi:hypothetical protein